jgi:hypothetical protein
VISTMQKYPVEDPYILISVFPFILTIWIGLFTEVLLVHWFNRNSLSASNSKEMQE